MAAWDILEGKAMTREITIEACAHPMSDTEAHFARASILATERRAAESGRSPYWNDAQAYIRDTVTMMGKHAMLRTACKMLGYSDSDIDQAEATGVLRKGD